MFSSQCFDSNGKKFADRLFEDDSHSLAEMFVHRIDLLTDILNGMPRASARYPEDCRQEERGDWHTNERYPAIVALISFLNEMFKHPDFNFMEGLNETNPNFEVMTNLILLPKLAARKINITDQLIDLMPKFKIEGISKITFTVEHSPYQYKLRSFDFPDYLIPSDYLCVLTNEIMTNPVVDKRMKAEVIEKAFLLRWIKTNGLNPFNRQPMTEGHLDEVAELKSKIDLFMAKIEYIYAHFSPDHVKKYEAVKTSLHNESLSLDDFRKMIAPQPSKLKGGFFMSESTVEQKLQELFNKYKINEINTVKAREKLLRCIAVNGNETDLKWFLENINVDVNAVDDNEEVKKTAAHWIVIKANAKPEQKETYLQCIKVLLNHGADISYCDAQGKTALDYDKLNYFLEVREKKDVVKSYVG